MLALMLLWLAQEAPRQEGVSMRFYFLGEPIEELCDLVAGQTPNISRIEPQLDFDTDQARGIAGLEYTFLAVVDGWIEIPAPGKWSFRLTSDDGSKLELDGRTLIEHDGLHGSTAKVAERELSAGSHPFLLRHFQCYGGWSLRLEWKAPGAERYELIPSSALRCPAGEVRVTAPGTKRILKPLSKLRPGSGRPLESVHPGYALFPARPADFCPKVGGLAFRENGDLLVSTWDPEGAVWALSGVSSGDPAKITARRIASGLAEPLGLCVVGKRVFVLQKQELTELIDIDGDGITDTYSCLCSDWNVGPNFHEFAFGLVHKDNWLYANLAIAIDPGGKSTRPQVPGRGEAIRISLENGRFETVAQGLRTPNGIGTGPEGELFLTDNQGDWLPASKLMRLEPGAFYGSRAVKLEEAAKLPVTPPVLWLPQNEIGNSPSAPALIPAGHGPYSGQLCHGDVTYGGVQRDFLEVIEGVWQGCVIPWIQGLEAGVNRLVFGPDGALYVGGIGSSGNWGQAGKANCGLQRLVWQNQPVFDLLAVRAHSDGLELEFTHAIGDGEGWEPENYAVAQWHYEPTEQYGGPKLDEQALRVRRVSVSADRRKVALQLEGLKEGHVVHVRIPGALTAQTTPGGSAQRLVAAEAWYTLNRLPKERPLFVRERPRSEALNRLSAAEREQGFELLFDGASTRGWRPFRGQGPVQGWSVVDGALARTGPGGDIITEAQYGDFELRLEWKVASGGNSGVFFRVDENHDAVWRTGAEMQVLDNDAHPDGRNPATSAGANYALHSPPVDATQPVGLWNRARLVVRGSHVEHWLNEEKLLEYELWSEEWKALVGQSKFASMPAYGLNKTGHIALQDHGDPVAFRNISIRKL